MWETVVVCSIVALVLAVTAWHLWRIVAGKSSSECGSGCSCSVNPKGCGQVEKPAADATEKPS